MNSVAWFDGASKQYQMALKFLGENDHEFSYNKRRPKVISDECRDRHENGETIFELRTNKLEQLPMVDFLPADYGSPNQAFGFTVGPVCFK